MQAQWSTFDQFMQAAALAGGDAPSPPEPVIFTPVRGKRVSFKSPDPSSASNSVRADAATPCTDVVQAPVASPAKAGAEATVAVSKTCPGCDRSRSDYCYFTMNLPVPWAFQDGRGVWCRDCHNAYRVMYAQEMVTIEFRNGIVVPETSTHELIYLVRPTSAQIVELSVISLSEKSKTLSSEPWLVILTITLPPSPTPYTLTLDCKR
jgi:hypothetical protein